FWGWCREIRRRSFDVYVDLHDTLRSRLWGIFSGVPVRVRYDKRAWPRRLLVWFKKKGPRPDGRVCDWYLESLGKMDVPVRSRRPELRFSEREGLGAAWKERLGDGPIIGIAPGARHATKRWLPERFAAAADELAEKWPMLTGESQTPRVLILGGADEREAAEKVLARLRAPALDTTGRTTVGELLGLVRRCALVLSNDSGVMHAAYAQHVPVVAVFGPTVREFGFFPEPDCSEVLERGGLYCRPCSLHGGEGCPEGHFSCMRDLRAEDAVAAAKRLLQRTRRTSAT
ncbi:MAG TPA: glycosyltransferase family 9 protein, partial [Elusimicrobiota bacterium]|nr:glycosyltransferase family 9 protein [Elusimicrobiota bacterium]